MTVSPAFSPVTRAYHPAVHRIGPADLRTALAKGWGDFLDNPTHVLFIVMIYPIAGVILAAAVFENDLLPLLFPLASGFALIGPFAAIGLYEMSRRRERGQETDWVQAYAPLTRRSPRAILGVGLVLTAIFLAWLVVAMGIYRALFDGAAYASAGAFLTDVLTTPRGWALIVVGNLAGAAFSLLALAVSAVSIPLLVDRDTDAGTAIETSMALMRENPGTMALWGVIVAALLVVGMASLFVGLAVVLPVLGHATWHLYRRAVGPA
ncbi:conserved hypothetical protein [Methylobacterium sp. 4-46]|uniref:DUF2189 domain-containing protein n=1 Tax=unclassified Methylobacterium TaxID=2615210 RepID=UPI000152D29E|nr:MULTISPECIES: DUF2189 domain-containing protein [Methylobacterium]ACA19665.1 conserved hypothetical protein [Methylobacterium sp. 4-46]WFT78861.1 DUF2189 domain-containing protein [Methylobacterium nodulans]